MAKWKVWYADGSTFSYLDGEPWQAPGLGVQVIRIYKDRSWVMLKGTCFYIWKGGNWAYADNMFDVWQYWFVSKTDEPKAVLAGELMETEDFTDIYRMAASDPEMND